MKKLYFVHFPYRSITTIELLQALSLKPNRFLRHYNDGGELFLLYLKKEEVALAKMKYSEIRIFYQGRQQ